MKQKDLAVLGAVAVFSGIVAFIIAGKAITTPANRQQQVEIVAPIDTQFSPPSSTYFNAQAIDPTKLIQIGPTSNQTPFNGQTN